MSENILLRVAGVIWVLVALFSVVQHEWYHSFLEGFLAFTLIARSFDENQ